ncbi:AMP-binding protein [Limobrevibacterium gyesilva]|uniref:AMP-binding protein n=1 Tax=Limobrevibacterium gyesilva TaxID=2991712 RepID=A0AA41YPA7_9PROT|nr:AMP-binding protein [Limobrevibacterium gyesilva]MCW3477219.1 AMP-binding protein [Limobrevibacterium gyesilva]
MNPLLPEPPRPWLSLYPPGMPRALPAPQRSLDALFTDAAARYRDRPFLTFLRRRTSYGEAAALIGRAAAGFRRLGVGHDTRVALCLPNSPGAVLCYFAVLRAGGTVVNLNPLAAEQQIIGQIGDSGAEVAVTVDLQPMFGRIFGALRRTRLRHVVVCRMAQMLPFPQSLAFRIRERARLAALPDDERVCAFATLGADADAGDVAPAPHPSGVAVIQYTGGTTADPKGVLLSHANLCANVAQLRAWFTRAEPGAERFLAVLPFFHCFGMTAVMNLAVALGGELVILPRFRPVETLRTIERRRVTILVGVPALFHALTECPACTAAALASLKVCVSGGDSLPEALARRFVALTGVPLAEGYGLTECGPVVTCSNPLEGIERPGSCGVPLPGTDVAIMAAEAPHGVLPPGEIGEICVRGPQVMLGYWQRPEATREAFRDGWLHTGDLGRLDRDGFLYFVNRQPEVIAVRGYKVYARAVEEAIRQHPAVAEVAVVGVPDPARGEVPKACIVLRAGTTLAAEGLRVFLADKVSPIEMPRIVEFRASLPKSAFGKVLKHELGIGARSQPNPDTGRRQ